MTPVFIAGCGYIGQRVARSLLKDGRAVTVLTHTDERIAFLEEQGLQVVRGDLDHPASLANLPVPAALIYYFAPPPPAGRVDSRMQNFLSAIAAASRPARVVLISTDGLHYSRPSRTDVEAVAGGTISSIPVTPDADLD